jgi:hypothetical protein
LLREQKAKTPWRFFANDFIIDRKSFTALLRLSPSLLAIGGCRAGIKNPLRLQRVSK